MKNDINPRWGFKTNQEMVLVMHGDIDQPLTGGWSMNGTCGLQRSPPPMAGELVLTRD